MVEYREELTICHKEVCLIPDKKSYELSDEFFKMRRLVLRDRARRQQSLIENARVKANDVAKMLKEDYSVKEVYLYGSLAWSGFTEDSDIDLLAVGFQGNYWGMFVKAERIAMPFEVSVVCEEDAHSNLRKEVLERGLPL